MSETNFPRILALLSLAIFCGCSNSPLVAQHIADNAAHAEAAPYQQRRASRDGTGKFYLGREIAQVMGHRAAGWLERPSREREEKPTLVVGNLDLKPDHVVVDLGAGTGHFSFLMAPLVPKGEVIAVDIQPEMLALIERRRRARNVRNVTTRLGGEKNPNLPEGRVDLVLMVDAYHEFSYPLEIMTAVVRSLKPGGRVVLVEYRGEDRDLAIKPLHKMTQRQVRKEMSFVGLRWRETRNVLPTQHLMVFVKP